MLEMLQSLRPDGTTRLGLRLATPTVDELVALAKPQKGLPDFVNDWRSDNWKRHVKQRGLPQIKWAERKGVPTMYGDLRLAIVQNGVVTPLGLASLRVVTDTGVAYIVDAFENLTEPELMKFHGLGTNAGAVAEAAANTALNGEFTTQYNPDNTRATGTTTEAANNIYQTVATNNFDAAVAIGEHAIFNQAATGGGVMLDRSVFSTVNLASGDGLQSDYRLTFTSGG
jgi:hypothetical protein